MTAMHIAKLFVIAFLIAYVSIGLLLFVIHWQEIKLGCKTRLCMSAMPDQICYCSECCEHFINEHIGRTKYNRIMFFGIIIGGWIDVLFWPTNWLKGIYFRKYPKGELPK